MTEAVNHKEEWTSIASAGKWMDSVVVVLNHKEECQLQVQANGWRA